MRLPVVFVLLGALLAMVLVVPSGPLPDAFVGPVRAQDPQNQTVEPEDALQTPYDETFVVQVSATNAFRRIGENEAAEFSIIVRDLSTQGTEFLAASLTVRCGLVNQTQGASNWVAVGSALPPLPRHGEVVARYLIATGPKPTPEVFWAEFECSAGPPINDVVGRFRLTAQAEEYVYMSVAPQALRGAVGPDEEVVFSLTLANSGSHPRAYSGRVDAPEGWVFPSPPTVHLAPGESTQVNVTGISPRDQLVYLQSSQVIRIDYYPIGAEGKAQPAVYSVQVKGVYLHPAIVPFTVLLILVTGLFIFLAILAKRQIEEQILGKPTPPWRIPEEIEMLNRLERDNPDEFYIVRYYLMVEEHESAMLWYKAFKRATKKDRKREAAWFKIKSKQERKVAKLEARHERIDGPFDRKVKFARWREGRKVRKLERKNERDFRVETRTFDRKRRKKIRKIDKRHAKRVARIEKRFDRQVARENKKVLKENRKREKRGEEPLPMPEMDHPVIDPPEYPPDKEIVEIPLAESRYAKKADKVHARFDRKVERIDRRRERVRGRDRARIDGKTAKLLARIPPEPETKLYDSDQYLSPEEIIVETEQTGLARLLRLPTLEERERARRRAEIYRAQRDRLKAEGDLEAVSALEERYRAERNDARERKAGDKATLKEAKALERERRKQVKVRARELAKEAKMEARGDKLDQRSRPAPEAEPPSPRDRPSAGGSPKRPGAAEKDPGATEGIRARFRRGKRRNQEADSEEPKAEAAAASSSGADDGARNED